MEGQQAALARFLSENFYNEYRVLRMRRKATAFREARCSRRSRTSRGSFRRPRAPRIEEHGQWRGVCDYLAGMTDREALLEYRRLFGADAETDPLR